VVVTLARGLSVKKRNLEFQSTSPGARAYSFFWNLSAPVSRLP